MYTTMNRNSSATKRQIMLFAGAAVIAMALSGPALSLETPRSDKASNILPADTRSNIAPELPPSPVGDAASTHDYLQAARDSLVAGRTGEAQQSLEMAETRILPRAVPAEQANMPIDDPVVTKIRHALYALATGDRKHSVDLITVALAS